LVNVKEFTDTLRQLETDTADTMVYLKNEVASFRSVIQTVESQPAEAALQALEDFHQNVAQHIDTLGSIAADIENVLYDIESTQDEQVTEDEAEVPA
jgi:hypothetical protein